MKKLILTTFLTLLSLAASAQFNSGNKLLADMNDTSSSVNRMHALGYVVGVVDSLNRIMFCIPSNATAGQLHDMVHNYLTAVPAIRHKPADVIISDALGIAFPCPKGGGI